MQQLFRKVVMLVALFGLQQIFTMPFDTEKAAFKIIFLQEQNRLKSFSCKELDALYEKASSVGIAGSQLKFVIEEVATEAQKRVNEEASAKDMVYAVKVYNLICRCSLAQALS